MIGMKLIIRWEKGVLYLNSPYNFHNENEFYDAPPEHADERQSPFSFVGNLFGIPGFGQPQQQPWLPPGSGFYPGFPGQPGYPPGQQPGFPGQQPGFQPGAPGQPPSQAGPPTTPPPSTIPQQSQVQLFAVDQGAMQGCLYRFTYVWLNNRQSFWFYPTFVGRRSVSGYRWTGFMWVYFGIDLRRIESFQCF